MATNGDFGVATDNNAAKNKCGFHGSSTFTCHSALNYNSVTTATTAVTLSAAAASAAKTTTNSPLTTTAT